MMKARRPLGSRDVTKNNLLDCIIHYWAHLACNFGWGLKALKVPVAKKDL